MKLFLSIILAILLIIASYFDIKEKRIPNRLIILGFLPLLFVPNIFTIITLGLALITGLLLNRLIGAGDIKLAFLIASYSHLLSWSQFWIYFALVSGGIFALIARKRSIAFAPFMGLGVVIAYLARAQSII